MLEKDKKFDISITQSTLVPTNKDIILTIIATDEGSGIKEIVLPDGTKVTEERTTYIVTENGSYNFIARDNAGNETEETIEITNIDKVPPVITIEPYETEPTNEDITVYATVDKGTLNKTEYTFTENGSFTFIAEDEAGNRVEKTVTITNIDKTLPTEGEIIIIAVDEKGKSIKTIQKKNLGLGVQVITAPEISGCKLISTPVVTIWLKPADSVKKVTFTYKLDMNWGGWKEAEKAVQEAEKKVKVAEEHPTKENKEKAQAKIDEARDLVEKLPGSEKKDELNKKIKELQDRLNKVIIPNEENIRIKDDIDNNKEEDENKSETSKPELKNISLNEFVARWKGHEVLSPEPILIENSKATYELQEDKVYIMNEKGLSPRFYEWNKEKEKWVALATKIDKDKIETYKDVEGYVAAFAVKQPNFSDIKGSEWYASTTDRANGLAMVEGYTDKEGNTTLKPNNTISRAELYTMVGRLFGAVPTGQTSLYKELDNIVENEGADWYKPYLKEYENKKIIDKMFNKGETREEINRFEVAELLTTMLERVEEVDYINLKEYKDTANLDNVKIANIIDGYGDKTLRLNNKITRAEAITLIINALEKLGW